MSSELLMNTLLTFDATRFSRHISPRDDATMVDYIVRQYGSALQFALRYFEGELSFLMKSFYDEAYLAAVLSEGNPLPSQDTDDIRKFIKRTVTEDGTVVSTKARYNELVELITETFNTEVGAVLRSIQSQPQKIYTVTVLGYENRLLRVLLSTEGPITL